MKILNGSNLGFVGEFVLGVIIAWLVAVPQQTAGEQLRGNCSYGCIGESYIHCAPKVPGDPAYSCDALAYQCIVVLGGTGTCYKGSGSPCLWNSNCQSQWHEVCVFE
jgi:hypothetical protein